MRFSKLNKLLIAGSCLFLISALLVCLRVLTFDAKDFAILLQCSSHKLQLQEKLIGSNYMRSKLEAKCRQVMTRGTYTLILGYIPHKNLNVTAADIFKNDLHILLATQVEENAEWNDAQIDKLSLLIQTSQNELNNLNSEVIAITSQCNSQLNFEKCACSNIFSNEQYIAHMKPTEKYQQVLAPLISYGNNDPELQGFGGYVLINTQSANSYQDLFNYNQSLVNNPTLPALVGIDGEGGIIQRLPHTYIKHLKELKSLDPNRLCSEIHNQATLFHSSGFNWTLSPVADITANPKDWIFPRIISSDIEEVNSVIDIYLDCMQQQNMIAVVKHFPGHGRTLQDSHVSVPVLEMQSQDWENYEKIPFENSIKNHTPMIMMGHMRYINIDSEISSLSNYWMQDVLRQKMHYDGIIVTDDLNMLAPKSTQECATLITESLNSGADLIMYAHYYNCDSSEILDYLALHVEEKDLEPKLNRILQLKKAYFCK